MQLGRILRGTGVGILLIVLAAGPFFRGLFFWTELLAAIALVSLGFALWLTGRRLAGLPAGLPGGTTGWALLALLGCYLVQVAWAVYPRGNLDWVLRVAAAWFAYTMIRAEAGPALRRWLAWTFVLSAAAVGVVGFLEFTGYFLKDPAMAEALSLVGLQNRMFTTLQYPNTAAAYFLAACFVSAGLGVDEQGPWKLGMAGALMTLLSLSFFFAVSRGALVVLPFGLLLFFLGLHRDRRWPALLLLLVSWAPMLATLKGIGDNAAARDYIGAFKWIGLAMVGGGVGGLLLAYFLRLRRRGQALLAGAALVVAAAAFGVWRPAGPLLPAQASRLFDINFKTTNVVLRLIYDQDAAQMIADRPLGRGGWGWERSYRQYQAFNYTARETHNHYAQTAVEAGAPGLVALVVAVLGALWAAWQRRKENVLGWSLAAGAALVMGHSLIDFDLSYGLIWLLVWALLAAAAEPLPAPRHELPVTVPGGVAGLGVAFMALVLAIGSHYTDQAKAMAATQPGLAAAVAQRARRFDPWNTDALLLAGDQSSLERAVRLDGQNPQVHYNLAIALELQQELPSALQEAKAAVAAQPMVSTYYDKAASLTGRLMVDALHEGQTEEARHLASELNTLRTVFTTRKATADPLQRLWNAPKLTMGPETMLRYGQALFLTGQEAEAVTYLQEAGKVGLLGSEAELWLYAIYERQGNQAAMAALEKKPWVRFRGANPVYRVLKEWE